jgi:hypothetical protein
MRIGITYVFFPLVFVVGCSKALDAGPARPVDLLDVVKEQQMRYVRESTGTGGDQCFTDDDLTQLLREGRPQKVASALSSDVRFLAIVEAIRALTKDEQSDLLAKARSVGRPTWREMGFIDPQGRGTTEAGREAEALLAKSIINLVQAMLRRTGGSAPHI